MLQGAGACSTDTQPMLLRTVLGVIVIGHAKRRATNAERKALSPTAVLSQRGRGSSLQLEAIQRSFSQVHRCPKGSLTGVVQHQHKQDCYQHPNRMNQTCRCCRLSGAVAQTFVEQETPETVCNPRPRKKKRRESRQIAGLMMAEQRWNKVFNVTIMSTSKVHNGSDHSSNDSTKRNDFNLNLIR